MTRGPRVVLGKVGLDGHDVGVLLVARRLTDAGFEVVYLGKRNRAADLVTAAIDEDAAAIGVSCLSGGLGYFATRVVELLEERRADIPVLAGGIDEPEEIRRMLEAGVAHHLGPARRPTRSCRPSAGPRQKETGMRTERAPRERPPAGARMCTIQWNMHSVVACLVRRRAAARCRVEAP